MGNTKVEIQFQETVLKMNKVNMGKFQRGFALEFNTAEDKGVLNLPHLLERLLVLRYTTLINRGANISMLAAAGYGSRGGIRPYVHSRIVPTQTESTLREFVVALPPCGPLTFRCICIGAITSYLRNHGHENASLLASQLGISRATVRVASTNYEAALLKG